MSATRRETTPKSASSRHATRGKRQVRHEPQHALALPADLDGRPTSRDAQTPSAPHLAPDQPVHATHRLLVGGALAASQGVHEPQQPLAGGAADFPPTGNASTPKNGTSGVHQRPSRSYRETQSTAAGANLDGRHRRSDPQTSSAPTAAPEAQESHGDHQPFGSGAASLLAIAAATLDDLERTRIAMGNRLRAMRDDHGLGDMPEADRLAAIHDALGAAEHQATLELQRALRRHPLHAWVKQTVGVGEKQAARLLAVVDDPCRNFKDGRPRRGVAEFWQYCGHGDPERSRRRKGQKVQFNPAAKMRAHLIAESCIKHASSPYRPVYDEARAAWADRDTTDGHKHNHALRLVAKAMLRDLFLAARSEEETR